MLFFFSTNFQVDSTGRKVPSWLQRFITVVLSSTALPALEMLLNKYATNQRQASSPFLQTILEKRPLLMLAITRLCLSIFYLKGRYFEASKLATQVEYRKIAANPDVTDDDKAFKSLGYLNLLKSAVLFGTISYSLSQVMRGNNSQPTPDNSEESEASVDIAPRDMCSLCYGPFVNCSVTPCGHLFCWSCVHEWLATKPECPLCRDEVDPKYIVLLQN